MARGATIGQNDAVHADARARVAAQQARPDVQPPPTQARRSRFQPIISPDEDRSTYLIDPDWRMISIMMAAGFLILGAISLSPPPFWTVPVACAAMLIPLFSRQFARFERQEGRSSGQRVAAMFVCIIAPMMLYGIAISGWASSAHLLDWIHIGGILLVTGGAVSTIQGGRIRSEISARMAMWIPAAIYTADPFAYLLLGIAAMTGFASIRRRAARDRLENEGRRQLEREQFRAEELLAEYEDSGLGWFWETDRRGMLTYLSPTVGRALGRDQDELLGKPFTSLFILDSAGQESERTLVFQLKARSPFSDLAVRAATGRDEERWWSVSGRPIHDSFNNFAGFRGSGSDLTEKKRAQESETRLAHYDSLTSLANRFQMSQTLEQILNAQREELRACSVFLLDLDRFKQVNDTMGHPAGDALLRQVAIRLENTVDKFGRVGRLGGDEFKVVLPGRHQREDLANLAQRIIENLSQPYFIDGSNVVIGVSIGIALAPDDGVTSEALIRNADLALYAAKDGGRGRHHFYASDLHADAEERRQLEEDLRDALQRGGLELFYQPVVSTSSEKITGFEALLRWDHPQHGYLSPAKFVPIAEDAGMIAAIGEWALRTACQDLANWPEEVRVAVNVSPLQFANPSLPAIVTNALAAAQIAPERLELEITESVFLNDDSGTDAMFAALKRVGVRLALDDFGTGFSSLGYLKKAPFDKIKIDQSFVRGATMKDSRNGAIIASIVSLAEALGMETTAEGVETLDELELMRILGCSHIQGFIYEKPLNTAAATDRLRNGLRAIAQGPRSARAVRQTTLRKAVLEHGGQQYHGTIRNISASGAMIEGLWNVPAGTVFTVQIAGGQRVEGTARWCNEGRLGIEFNGPVDLAADSPVRASAVRRVAETQQQRLQA